MMFRRRALLAACALSLTGCAYVPGKIESKDLAGKTIGVVSIVGHEFTRTYIGHTIFGNEHETHDIGAWQLDPALEEELAKALTGKGYNVIRRPHSGFTQIYRSNPWSPTSWANAEAPIRQYCADSKADAVAVLYAVGKSPENNKLTAKGAGTYAHTYVYRVWSVVHLFTELAFVDCATALPVVTRYVTANAPRNVTFETQPMLEVPRELATAPLDKLSDEQSATLKELLLKIAARSFPPTLDAIVSGAPPKPERKPVIHR